MSRYKLENYDLSKKLGDGATADVYRNLYQKYNL